MVTTGILLVFVFLYAVYFVGSPRTDVQASDFPEGWSGMEIEAKWEWTTEDIAGAEDRFNDIVAAFEDGSQYGYVLEVEPPLSRYVDIYYDTPDRTLGNAGHVIRHRVKRDNDDGEAAITDSFASLAAASWDTFRYNRVQYKSTPTRYAAVWFRTEHGASNLTSGQVTSVLGGSTTAYPGADDPVDLLLSDHPGFDFSALAPAVTVTQYRQRVHIYDAATGDELYEMTLDKIDTLGEDPRYAYGAEIEVVAEPLTEETVNRLFVLMQLFEDEFGLEPLRATSSKGGIEIADTAVPHMDISEEIIDYGQVQRGLAVTKRLTIGNNGHVPLIVSVRETDPDDPHRIHWSLVPSVEDREVPIFLGGPPLVLDYVYEPQDIGDHAIELTLASNDPSQPEVPIMLQGEAIPAVPMDAVLVLDRSGSMNEMAGGVRKIDALQPAADLFVHLLRDDIATGIEGMSDRVGMVKYNHGDDIYLAMGDIDDPSEPDSHLAAAETLLLPSVTTDTDLLGPSGRTGIGEAMVTASTMFTLADERPHIMIVFTDGKENTPRFVEEIFDDVSADSLLRIYSVGLGYDETINEDVLELIASSTGGYYQVTDTVTGDRRFELEEFYFNIFTDAAGMDLAEDPTVLVPLVGTDPITVHRTRITSSDRKANFLVLDDPAQRDRYDLALVAPNGARITPTSAPRDLNLRYLQRYTYTLYQMTLPRKGKAAAPYIGEWTVQLTPKKPVHPGQTVPVGFSAAVLSNYSMDVSLARSEGNFVATARLTNRGLSVTDAEVTATVTDPDKKTYAFTLYDNGTHGDQRPRDGIFTGTFTDAKQPGSYRFHITSSGKNERGELAPREATRFILISAAAGAATATAPFHLLGFAAALAALAILLVLHWRWYSGRPVTRTSM